MSTYIDNRAKDLGKPIEEATEDKWIDVSAAQIKNSRRKDSSMCALARSCEELHNVQAAFFLRSVAYLEYKTKFVRYQLPAATAREIVVFDRGGNMVPGRYQLRAPGKNETREAKRKYKSKHTETGKGPKRKITHIPGIRNALDPSYRVAKEIGAVKLQHK